MRQNVTMSDTDAFSTRKAWAMVAMRSFLVGLFTATVAFLAIVAWQWTVHLNYSYVTTEGAGPNDHAFLVAGIFGILTGFSVFTVSALRLARLERDDRRPT